MQTEISFLAAFVVGILGGVHCMGMCGGIVGALTLGVSKSTQDWQRRMFGFQLAYNAGRIISYSIAGALAGLLGLLAFDLSGVNAAQRILQLVAGLFMIALGLYLAGWWRGLVKLEQMGGVLWRRIEPLGKGLIPVRSFPQAFLLGLVWGWLPCGLVYSVLIWSLASGGMTQGALLMLGFGLGTLPNLLLMGVFATQLSHLLQKSWVHYLAGGLVILLGFYQIWLAVA
ncbi:MAG TPA: sulfite exporter TauE/SafE family protein [Chromatiales bacterium]|nr:sulfite exporter TauE/SafE family protein [Chromatiales bacterium]